MTTPRRYSSSDACRLLSNTLRLYGATVHAVSLSTVGLASAPANGVLIPLPSLSLPKDTQVIYVRLRKLPSDDNFYGDVLPDGNLAGYPVVLRLHGTVAV